MKARKKSYFGLSAGKFFVILLVVLASVYFIWQYVFVQNSKKSSAIGYNNNICCGNGGRDCPDGFKCTGGSYRTGGFDVGNTGYGRRHGCNKTCEPKNYRR